MPAADIKSVWFVYFFFPFERETGVRQVALLPSGSWLSDQKQAALALGFSLNSHGAKATKF